MKTLSELNSKMVYRIAKVLYFGIILLVSFIGVSLIYDSSVDYDYWNDSKTRITCASSGLSRDVLKSDYGISGNTVTLEQKKKMATDVCHFIPVDETQFNEFLSFSDVNYGLTFLSKNKVITASKSVQEDKFKWGYFLGYFIVFLAAVALFFEAVRRVFYYVMFGKFRPAKS